MKKTAIFFTVLIVLIIIILLQFFIGLDRYGIGLQLNLDFTNYDRVDYQLVESEPKDTGLNRLNWYTQNQLVEYMKKNNLLIEPKEYPNLLTSIRFKDLLAVLVCIKDPNAE